MKEYTLWALPKGETDRLHECVLTCAMSTGAVDVVKAQAAKDGWHGFRVQVIDGSIPDFAAALRKPRA